jgi:hypothetical protein
LWQSDDCGSCPAGFAAHRSACKDINECRDGSHTCNGTAQVCFNTIGGHRCDCKAGYEKTHNAVTGRLGCIRRKCPSAQSFSHSTTRCSGSFGDSCVVKCDQGYVSSSPATCSAAGKWVGGGCHFECPELTLSGDCDGIGNGHYKVQTKLKNGKAHYLGPPNPDKKKKPLNLYYATPFGRSLGGGRWVLDSDLDADRIHAHLPGAGAHGAFPMGRKVWTVYCGRSHGWVEMILDMECSGVRPTCFSVYGMSVTI